MFTVIKTFDVAISHSLSLNYESSCCNLHGHNLIITVYCKSENLNPLGMVFDFKMIKDKIIKKIDHKHLNNIFDFNPTSENIAKWIKDEIGSLCYKVSVKESDGNEAIYEI